MNLLHITSVTLQGTKCALSAWGIARVAYVRADRGCAWHHGVASET